ncbi:MAG: hypothetical protein U0361_07675 [Nitrospiraceae bacterium]
MDSFDVDRDEVSLGEYLAYLHVRKRTRLKNSSVWHVITVHSIADETYLRWPAL